MDNAHQTALTAKHAGLENQIALEQQRPLPNLALISVLKKRKLRLKEEIVIQ